MKKICLFAVFAAALAFVSCIREVPSADVPAAAPGDMETVTATLMPVGRTQTPDGVKVLWENKDALALRYQADAETQPVSCLYTTTMAAPKETAVFKKDAAAQTPNKTEGKFIAVYPASAQYLTWSKYNYVLLSFNPDQIARDQGFDPASALMIAASEEAAFDFSHVVSYIRFTVTSSTTPFKKVTVTSGDESQYMVSRIRVNFDETFSYALETKNTQGVVNQQTKDYVSLSMENEGNFTPGTYYLAVNPDKYKKGLKFTFENATGDAAALRYDGALELKPGEVLNAGTISRLNYCEPLPYLSVYRKGNDKLGVVFYEDPDDARKTKVVSSAGGVMQWATSNGTWRISSFKTEPDYVHAVVTASDAFKANADDFPAVKFCDQMQKSYGGNWHVPSVNELNLLFNAYYGKAPDTAVSKNLEYTDNASKAAAAYFDGLLTSAGGGTLLGGGNEYWICGQNSTGNMQFVNLKKYNNGHDVQTNERYLRCVRDVDASKSDDTIEYPQTDIGKVIKGGLSTRITDVLWDTTYTVTNGLDYYQMRLVTDAGELQKVYLLRADPSKGLAIKAGISNQTTTSNWVAEKLSVMAAHMNTTAKPLYAMINADFLVTSPTQHPRGPVHCNGTVWCGSFDVDEQYPEQAFAYIGVTSDGKVTIGPRENYPSVKSSLKECSGTGVILVQNSTIKGGYTFSRHPRTGMGYTAANIVWMMVVDGRHGTNGMSYTEMGSLLYGAGCTDAVNLDGGGSSQMLVRDAATGKITTRNWPSDPSEGAGGEERARLNAWAIVKK